MNAGNISSLLCIVGALVAVTNIITEVLKKITWDKLPTNFLVVIISEALTILSGAAYAEVTAADVAWYHVAAAVVVGLFVAYAAMFGFDKFKQALERR